jgi:hypothetical protein
MKFVLVSFLVLVVLFFSLSCNEGYDYSQAALGLDLQDFSCTEAWIEVQIGSNDKTANIYIKKNDEIIQTVNVGESETLFYFDGLLPNTTYKFDAVTYEDGKEVKSNPVTFTTLDTTSHNFTWQTFTFGESDASWVYDIAIIDENNIWAVGEIYMNDSLGNPDSKRYNAVIWDGTKWSVIRIPYYFQGQPFYNPIQSVFTFGPSDVWFCGNGVVHFDGSSFIPVPIPTNVWGPYQMNKIWGSSSNDLYVVGNSGNIAHYNGASWGKIESGTTSIINDAWGITNEQNKTILNCAVSSFFVPGDKKILKIVDGKVDSVIWNRDVRLYSAWATNENFLYVCGEGVFVNKFGIWNEIMLQPVGTNSVRGNGINDIFICGDYGFIAHFNGLNWHIYNNNYLKGYSRLSFKGDIVAIAGNYQGKAIVEIGRRN